MSSENHQDYSPEHITKYANNYEEKLVKALIEKRGLAKEYILAKREEYKQALTRETAINSPTKEFPLTVNIELTNKCNYKCSMCFTVSHEGAGISLGLDNAKKIIDECAQNELMTLFIANGSEPTISVDFKDVVSYATKKIPDVAVFTNAVKLDKQMSQFLLDSGLTRLNISLDAATKETYKTIRGGNLDDIERKINQFLEMRGNNIPLVRVSFVEQPENKTEVELFINKWKDKVESVEIQKLHNFEHLADLRVINNVNQLADIEFIGKNSGHCYSPFSYLAVWSNGQISPCCSFHGSKLDIDNINRNASLKSMWNSEYMKELRRQFKIQKLNDICRNCIDCTG